MGTIAVLALYDERLNSFFPDGKLFNVGVESTVYDTVEMPGSLVPVANTPGIQPITLLKIRDKAAGVLYLNLTLDEYNALISEATQSPNKTILFEHTVTLAEEGDTFIFDGLDNSTIIGAFVDGVLTQVTYTSNGDGTGTIVFPVDLVEGTEIAIQYYKN